MNGRKIKTQTMPRKILKLSCDNDLFGHKVRQIIGSAVSIFSFILLNVVLLEGLASSLIL
jgi:hypothetical protein